MCLNYSWFFLQLQMLSPTWYIGKVLIFISVLSLQSDSQILLDLSWDINILILICSSSSCLSCLLWGSVCFFSTLLVSFKCPRSLSCLSPFVNECQKSGSQSLVHWMCVILCGFPRCFQGYLNRRNHSVGIQRLFSLFYGGSELSREPTWCCDITTSWKQVWKSGWWLG